MLTGGDRRSISRANEVVQALLQLSSAAVAQLICLMQDPDSIVRMRAADALENFRAKAFISFCLTRLVCSIRYRAQFRRNFARI